jgi:O-antigen ligase
MLYNLLLLFCLYLPFQVALNPAEGIDLASSRVFILILAFLWVISGLKNRKVFVPAKIQTILIISFLFLAGFSLFWAENFDWGVRKLLFLLSIFPIYFVTAGLSSAVIPSERSESRDGTRANFKDTSPQPSPRKREGATLRIAKFIVYGAGLAAFVGIIQFLLQFIVGLDATTALWRNYVSPLFLGKAFSQAVAEYPSWAVAIGGKDYLRAFGTFPDPHMLSFYLGLTLPLAAGLYYAFRKNIYLILFLTILAADLLTFSRGGYLGLAAGLLFIAAYFAFAKKIPAKKIFVSFALMLVALVSLSLTPIGKRAITSFSIEENSNKERFENWAQAATLIKNNPQGVGIGNYSSEIKPSTTYREPIYAHNLYLDVAAETGIINAVIFTVLILISIFYLTPRPSPFGRGEFIKLAGAAGLVIFSVHSIFDTALYSAQVLPLLLVIIALSVPDNPNNSLTAPDKFR